MKDKERELLAKIKEYTEINKRHFELYCQERRDVRKETEKERITFMCRATLIVIFSFLLGFVLGCLK